MTAPQSLDAGTEYVVFEKVDLVHRADEDAEFAWKEVARVTARDSDTAIKSHAAGRLLHQMASTGQESYGYAAVPARSFNRVNVTPKVETTLVLEEAK